MKCSSVNKSFAGGNGGRLKRLGLGQFLTSVLLPYSREWHHIPNPTGMAWSSSAKKPQQKERCLDTFFECQKQQPTTLTNKSSAEARVNKACSRNPSSIRTWFSQSVFFEVVHIIRQKKDYSTGRKVCVFGSADMNRNSRAPLHRRMQKNKVELH